MGQPVRQLGMRSYSIIMQDYGGPVGFRLAIADTPAVKVIVAQNATASLPIVFTVSQVLPDRLGFTASRGSRR